MYTDTDSLVYHIQTDDFYKDLAANSSLLDRMDTANLPSDHPCYVIERKKSPGYFSYAFNVYAGPEERVGGEKIKAKGIRDHRKCLFEEDGLELYTENVSIRSFNHQLMTIKTKKLTYNSYDDKRVVLEDKIHTLAHGHYSREEDEPEDEWPELDYEVDDRGRRWSKLDKEFMRGLLCYTTK